MSSDDDEGQTPRTRRAVNRSGNDESKPTKGASSPATIAIGDPSSPPKRLRRNPAFASNNSQLSSLLREMDELIAIDRILDARLVVDKIRTVESQIGLAPHGLISPDTCSKMETVVSESDHIRHLLRDLRSDDTWHLVKQTKAEGGITVHYRNEEGSPIHSVKTHTILEGVDATGFVRICSLFLESDLFPLWAPGNIIESSDVLASPSKFRQIIHQKLNFGKFSPISPRDSIVDGRGYHLAEDNAVLILASSIAESPYCKVPPKSKSRVRIDLQQAFYIELLPGNRVLFRQISHDDLKLRFMPAFVVNWISQGAMPVGFIHSLKSVLRRYESTEFHQRMQQRRDLYGEIEERVHTELVSKVSRMDSGDTMSEAAEGDEDGHREPQAPKERTLKECVPSKNTFVPGNGNMSTFATCFACLACIFIAQIGVRLSLFWAVLPRNIQRDIALCILCLPILIVVDAKMRKSNGRNGKRVRIRKSGDVISGTLSTALQDEELPTLFVMPVDEDTLLETPRKKLFNAKPAGVAAVSDNTLVASRSRRKKKKRKKRIRLPKVIRTGSRKQ